MGAGIFWAGALGAALVCAAPVVAAPEAIPFQPLPEAVEQAAAADRVTLVFFSAPWCGWCHRMEASTFADPQVLQWADRYAFAKVDVDAEPAVASAFGVQTLPAVALLSARGELLKQVSGYQGPQVMAQLLAEHVDQAQAPGQQRQQRLQMMALTRQLASADAQTLPRLVQELLAILAQPDRAGRPRARQQLVSTPAAAPHLVAALQSEVLAQRAAAHDVLVEMTAATLPYDPFADAEQRQAQAAKWRALIGAAGAQPAEAPTPAPAD